jgi:spore photoproduct lyase
MIEKLLIEKGAEPYQMTERLLSKLRSRLAPPEPCGPKGEGLDKGTIRALDFPGEFLKPCPGTKSYICCGYQILNTGTNCPLDCSYCILQAYVNLPSLRVHVNLEQKLEEIGTVLDQNSDRIFRLGTGEFTDSLALDPWTGWSRILPPFILKRRNAVLEFKTKTVCIEDLLASPVRDRIIVSWSLNSPFIAAREEHGAPGIRRRLEAARSCQEEGFVVGFHFDPLIVHPQWEKHYLETIEMMDRMIDPARVIWVSLGCFRFMPHLKPIIRDRHRETCVLNGEFVRGLDGKMRYFKPIRIELYRFIKQQLDAWHEDLGLYLCMESDEVWQRAMGRSPFDSTGLRRYLDLRALKFFPSLGTWEPGQGKIQETF